LACCTSLDGRSGQASRRRTSSRSRPPVSASSTDGAPLLDHPAVLHDDHPVGVQQGGQAVRDDDPGGIQRLGGLDHGALVVCR
jgi:hypothetical protein